MPILPVYQAKEALDPDSRGMPRPQFTTALADAQAGTGAAVSKFGGAISQMGDGFQAIADRAKQMQEQKEAFNTKLALDNLGSQIDREDEQELQKAPPDGSGFTQSRMDAFAEKSSKFLTEVVPPKLREEYAQRLQNYREKKFTQYSSTEAKLLGDFSVKQLDSDVTHSKNEVYKDPGSLDERIADIEDRVRVAPGIAEAAKPALIKKLRLELKEVAAGRLHPNDGQATAEILGLPYDSPKLDRLEEKRNGKSSGGAASEGAAMSFFMSKGWTKEQAAGIVGNLLTESRLNTGARAAGDGADGSDSIGIAQWNSGRAVALRNFAATRGKPVTDLQTQLEFVDHELRTSHKGAGDKLSAATNAAEAAAAIVTDYERPAGSDRGAAYAMHWNDRLGHARRLATGNEGGVRLASASTATDAAPQTGAAGPVDVAPEQAARQKLAPDPRFDELPIETKLRIVKNAEIGQAQQLALETQRVTQAAAEAEKQRSAWVDQQQFAASKGQLVREQVEQDFRDGRYKSFEEYNGVISQLNKADKDEANVRAGVAKLQTPGAVWTADDKDLLSAMDRKAGVPEAIQKGDQVAVADLASRFRKTGMVSPEVKQLFEGIPKSGSPGQIQFAMSALDQMYRSNPNAFEQAFGTPTRQALTLWQSMIDKDPKAFQAELKRVADPATLKARESVETEGRKVAEAIDDKKLLNSFTDHWYSFQPGRPFTPPEVPGMAVLKVEFANTFAEEYRLAQGDERKATENTMRRLRETWSVSPSSGGKLVKYAPELLLDRGFPKVAGTGDWLVDQVEAEVRKSGGEVPTRLGKVFGVAPGATRPTYGLFATEETRAEIDALKAGRPLPGGRKSPEWTLVWEDPGTGLKMMKPFSFNVDAAVADRDKHAREMQADHERALQSAGAEMEKTRQTFEELRRRAQQGDAPATVLGSP